MTVRLTDKTPASRDMTFLAEALQELETHNNEPPQKDMTDEDKLLDKCLDEYVGKQNQPAPLSGPSPIPVPDGSEGLGEQELNLIRLFQQFSKDENSPDFTKLSQQLFEQLSEGEAGPTRGDKLACLRDMLDIYSKSPDELREMISKWFSIEPDARDRCVEWLTIHGVEEQYVPSLLEKDDLPLELQIARLEVLSKDKDLIDAIVDLEQLLEQLLGKSREEILKDDCLARLCQGDQFKKISQGITQALVERYQLDKLSESTQPLLQVGKPYQVQTLEKPETLEEFSSTFEGLAKSTPQGETQITEDSRRSVKAMNAEAEAEFKEYFEPWKREVEELEFLFPAVDLLKERAKLYLKIQALAMGAMSLWAFKSSKFLAAVNGCAAVGPLFFLRAIDSYALAARKSVQVIKALNVHNQEAFSKEIDQHFAQAEKMSRLLRCYFSRRRMALSEKHQSLSLLKEDLDAIRGISAFFAYCYKDLIGSSQLGSSQPIDRGKIIAFLNKLKEILYRGCQAGALGTVMGVGYLYCAYINRAYLMVVAGLIFFLVSGFLCIKFRSCHKKIAQAQAQDEEALLNIFNNQVFRGYIPQAKDLSSIQTAIVIPLEKVLKLIPIAYPKSFEN